MNDDLDLNNSLNREKIKRVCIGVLSDFAPEELILLDHVVDEIVATMPDSMDNLELDNQYVDTPLGFGSNPDLYTTIIVPIIIGLFSKLATSFSDEKLKQAAKLFQSGRKEKGITVEAKFDEVRKEVTFRLSNHRLTRKQAETITNRILQMVSEELLK